MTVCKLILCSILFGHFCDVSDETVQDLNIGQNELNVYQKKKKKVNFWWITAWWSCHGNISASTLRTVLAPNKIIHESTGLSLK